MKICYFGIYKSDYSRNKIILSGLRANGVEVLECRTEKGGVFKYFDLIKKHWRLRNEYEVMIVAFPGFQSVILAKFLTRKPIIFDAFVSMYDSMVLDRKQVLKSSLMAKYFWWLDKISMSVSDLVLIDTNEHKKYISKEFGIREERIERLFLGAYTNIFYPRKGTKKEGNVFKVLFYGTYIPLQGVEYIVKAAKLLEKEKDIIFELIGNGQEKDNILKLAKSINIGNVDFIDNLPISRLAEHISFADVCLGVFGNTEKTKRVIPNKVYECVAMKKLVITADTLAEREIFEDGEMIFTKIADSESIASAIMKVKNWPALAIEIAEKGYNKFVSVATIDKIGFELKKIIEKINE